MLGERTSTKTPPTADDTVDADLIAQLRLGAVFGLSMAEATRRMLEQIVTSGTMTEEGAVRIRPSWVPFRTIVNKRRIDRLLAMRFIWREGPILHPTVAGVGAVLPFHRAITDTTWLRQFQQPQ